MLGYLRELYEIYATHQEGKPYTPPPVAPQAAPAPKPQPKPTPPPAPSITPAPAPPITPPPPPAAAPPKSVLTPPPVAPPPPPAPVTTTPTEPPKPRFTPPVSTPAVPPTPPPSIPSADIRELFSEDAAASRFGRQPLANLTKALTINNRVLFSRDLFGNDNDLLNTSLRTLNTSGSFAAAQPVLESMARRFDWTQEDKVETAKEFIELVRRRYV